MTSLLSGTEWEDRSAQGTFCHVRSAASILKEGEARGGGRFCLADPGVAHLAAKTRFIDSPGTLC